MSAAESITPKEWMTAAEIAGLKLKLVPHDVSNVIKLAKREGWRDSGFARQRDGRGGGWEYHVTLLPGEAVAGIVGMEKLLANEGKGSEIAKAAAQELTAERPAMGRLTARQRATMEARAALLTEIDRLVLVEVCSRSCAVGLLLEQVGHATEAHPLCVAARGASERQTLSRSLLLQWLRERDQLGLIGLAPKLKRRQEALPAWFDDFLRHYARPAKPCISEALDAYLRTLPDPAEGPNYDQVRLALGKLGPLERAQGREGKLAMRKRLAYVSRDTSDLLPSSVYVADGKTFDAEIQHPIHGGPFRPEITSIIDAATRVCVGWSADLSERTFAVTDALRVACTRWGIPAIFYTDRGPGYVSKGMVDPLIGFLGRAGITPMKALPYNSQGKGLVERFNQTYTPLAKSFPTYLGSDMDPQAKKLAFKVTRKELKTTGTSRTLPSWATFLERLDATVADYNDWPHSSLPKIKAAGRIRHMTPNEAWAAKCAEGFEPIVPSAAEVEEMFRPWMVRRVQRGLVKLFENEYFYVDLQAFDGEDVVVGYDIHDAAKVWVRRIDKTAEGRRPGVLIGTAVFAGNKTRYVSVTAEQHSMEGRIRGRQNRNNQQKLEIDAEAQAFRLLELDPAAAGVAMQLVAANDAEPIAVPEPSPRLGPTGRPLFGSDEAFAAWLLAHPDQVGPADAYQLSNMLDNPNHRSLFRSHGLDLDALRKLARATA